MNPYIVLYALFGLFIFIVAMCHTDVVRSLFPNYKSPHVHRSDPKAWVMAMETKRSSGSRTLGYVKTYTNTCLDCGELLQTEVSNMIGDV